MWAVLVARASLADVVAAARNDPFVADKTYFSSLVECSELSLAAGASASADSDHPLASVVSFVATSWRQTRD